MNLLQTVGVMALVFGMQITFEAEQMAEMVDVFDSEKLTFPGCKRDLFEMVI